MSNPRTEITSYLGTPALTLSPRTIARAGRLRPAFCEVVGASLIVANWRNSDLPVLHKVGYQSHACELVRVAERPNMLVDAVR
jgi:hypothetical protein